MVGDLNEQQRSYIRKMIGGVESMARLVNNLLDLGRIEAGVGLQVENVALKEIIENIIGTLQLSANQKNLRLGLEMDRELPLTIEADKGLLHQAVYNLVENAIKYTPEGGWVILRVNARSNGVQFEVQDNGIGVAPADQPRLFEKFYRGSQREARHRAGAGHRPLDCGTPWWQGLAGEPGGEGEHVLPASTVHATGGDEEGWLSIS
jgi:signal transduction histidine kinase